MRTRSRNPKRSRGTSLIEAIIALATLAAGLAGFASLQVVTARTNTFGQKMAQASALASDLEESIRMWSYNDARLNALGTVNSTNATQIASTWDLGTTPATAYTVEYSELAADTNASNAGALGATYPGLIGDMDRDGRYEFVRYWNVYNVDLSNVGTPNGKLVQIIVRWREPGLGYRQVTSSAFKVNPAYAFR